MLGFRAPTFSLVPESRWAVDVLADIGFTYSSSVLPARSPLFGDPTLPTTPFRWPNGLVELPCPVVRAERRRAPLPRRRLPARASRARRRPRRAAASVGASCSGSTATPTTSIPTRTFWVVPDAGRWGSRLLWYNRRRTFAKVESVLRGRRWLLRSATNRLHEVDCQPMSDRDFSQLDMVHRLPPAPLVDRFAYLRDLAPRPARRARRLRRRRLPELNEAAGALAPRAPRVRRRRELVGLDLDETGVADARARGYEAYAVDCRDADAVRALGLAPADLVVAGEVIEHLDDRGPFLDGLHALVAPGGLLVGHHAERARRSTNARRRCSATSR